MPKRKERSGEEFWRSKCRELEKRVRELERAVKQHSQRNINNQSENAEYRKKSRDVRNTFLEKKTSCPECGKGQLIFVDFTYVKYQCCNVCDWREKIK